MVERRCRAQTVRAARRRCKARQDGRRVAFDLGKVLSKPPRSRLDRRIPHGSLDPDRRRDVPPWHGRAAEGIWRRSGCPRLAAQERDQRVSGGPTFEEIFAVMSAASVGDPSARVDMPVEPNLDDTATRFAIATNVLLDDLAYRMNATETELAERGKA